MSKSILGVVMAVGVIVAAWSAARAQEQSAEAPVEAKQAEATDAREAVVKIHTTHRLPNVFQPWRPGQLVSGVATGVVLPGHKIITNAHAVVYGKQIFVQPYRSSERYTAKVEAMSIDMDLAILKIDEKADEFFKDRKALQLAESLPRARDRATAFGYAAGGSELSVTEGIVSRVEMASLNGDSNGNGYGVRVQVDAPLNAGNSGGPVMIGDRMAGIVFETMEGENIGFIIPAQEIQRFLKDAADGEFRGKPRIDFHLQTLENETLRAYLNVPESITGIVVNSTQAAGEDFPLKPWDIITQVGDHSIDNTGMVEVGDNLRLGFHYYWPEMADAHHDRVPLTVFRKGKSIKIELPVKYGNDDLIQPLSGEDPSYFIYGPLVFSPVHQVALEQWARGYLVVLAATESPVVDRMMDTKRFEGEQLVFVTTRMFPHRITKGYGASPWRTVKSVNGTTIRSLPHMVTTLRDCTDEYVVFEFNEPSAERLVFRRSDINDATEEILTENGVRNQASEDLMKLWNAKPQ